MTLATTATTPTTSAKSRTSPLDNDGGRVEIHDAIRKYELQDNIVDLEMVGLTIIPPEKAAPPGFADRLREAFLRVVAERDGHQPDLVGGETHKNAIIGNYDYLLFEDPVFEELAVQPVPLTLADYLLGMGCIVNASAGIIKGPTEFETPNDILLPLHSDNQMQPSPFPRYAEVANVTWILSDYDKDNGALAYVPGSHTIARHPLKGEADHLAVPVEAPAGSVVVWHGNTWHGAYRRTAPGLRLSVGYLYSRPHIVPRQPFREDVTAEMLERNPARFAKLMGKHLMVGWRAEGPLAVRTDDTQTFFDTVFA